MVNKTELTSALRARFGRNQVDALVNLFKIAPANFPRDGHVGGIEAMKMGLIFTCADGTPLDSIPVYAYAPALEAFGIDAQKFNQTFYKSFADVRDGDPMQLLFDQILHYFTTYGADAMGIDIPTYVPAASLEVPDMNPDAKYRFTVIQMVSDDVAIARIDKYFANLAAPNKMIRAHIDALLPATTLETDDIRSFELQVQQHKARGTVPRQPVNQLRFIVHMTTGDTMLIKNRYMREMIQNAATRSGDIAYDLFMKCNPQGLASIFLRYKPIFLAFKKHNKCASLINHLRREADTYHKPLPQIALQNFTQIDDPKAQAEIVAKATNRDLVKLLNSINTRVLAGKGSKDNPAVAPPAVYQVRNGRTFVREGATIASPRLEQIGKMIYQTLVDRLSPSIKGKKFYIPKGIQYAIPTTEKQFLSTIPYGTRIVGLPTEAFTAGVQWFNQGGRTDIDLHMNSATEHFGWNSRYHDGEGEVIYTGDLTDAPLPHGAAEAYWFKLTDTPYILTANLYSGSPTTKFKFAMTSEKPDVHAGHRGRQNGQYTMNMNNLLFAPIELSFQGDDRGLTLGMFANNAFYFYGGTLANGIVPSANYGQFIEGLTTKLNAQMMFNFFIKHCGGEVLSELPEAPKEEDFEFKYDHDMALKEYSKIVSLSPEDLATDTLINIIDGN